MLDSIFSKECLLDDSLNSLDTSCCYEPIGCSLFSSRPVLLHKHLSHSSHIASGAAPAQLASVEMVEKKNQLLSVREVNDKSDRRMKYLEELLAAHDAVQSRDAILPVLVDVSIEKKESYDDSVEVCQVQCAEDVGEVAEQRSRDVYAVQSTMVCDDDRSNKDHSECKLSDMVSASHMLFPWKYEGKITCAYGSYTCIL